MTKSQIPCRIAAGIYLMAASTLVPALASQGEQTFVVTIKNVTTDKTLKLADGTALRAPIAPGVYAIVNGEASAFEDGKSAGNSGLESLAEDGNAEPLMATLQAMQGVSAAGMFVPGQPFEVTLQPGEKLLFATMFVQSNDKFFASDPRGLELFDSSGAPISGNLTKNIKLWDAGTEIDQPPGAGTDQAPRQKGPNTGQAEGGVVRPASDGFTYPAVEEVIQLNVSPV